MHTRWEPVTPESFAQHLMEGVGSDRQVALREVYREAPSYTGVSVSVFQLTAAAMASLDFKELAQARGRSDTFFYILEVAAYTGTTVQLASPNPKSSRVLMKRSGIGFRVGVAAWNIATDMAATLSSVAASAKLKGAMTAMKVRTYGFGLDAIDTIKELGSHKEGFTPQVLSLIGAANEKLTSYVVQNQRRLVPEVLNVAEFHLPRYTAEHGAYNLAVSWHFALESVYRLQSLETATRRILEDRRYAPHAVLPMLAASYEALGVTSARTPPDGEAKDEAWRLLNLGR